MEEEFKLSQISHAKSKQDDELDVSEASLDEGNLFYAGIEAAKHPKPPRKSNFILRMERQLLEEICSENPDFNKIRDFANFEEVNFSVMDDSSGMTLLHHAAYAGEMDLCRFAHRDGVPIDKPTTLGRTPLHFAAMNNKTRIVEWLVNNGADVNQTTIGGLTALHFAARQGATATVHWLLFESGQLVDAEHEDHDRKTPIEMCKNHQTKDVIQKYLDEIKSGARRTPKPISS
eukprot:GDKI01044959.1.p1 GENE.GDKI01044959.1~~GDKI01044959.1.p1  ORF type:complete len:232 (-),score=45.12 GDKI01044959.1:28-723(-)